MVRTWAPSPVVVAAGTVGTALLAFAATQTDVPGAVLASAAAALLGLETLRAALLRPVLLADAGGLTVVQGLRRRTVPWDQVHSIAAVAGRRGAALEVDCGDTVYVLPGWRLGGRPSLVAEGLEQVRAEVG